MTFPEKTRSTPRNASCSKSLAYEAGEWTLLGRFMNSPGMVHPGDGRLRSPRFLTKRERDPAGPEEARADGPLALALNDSRDPPFGLRY